MNQARLYFRMKAKVDCVAPDAEPSPDRLPPGWVRIPVSFQVTLPAEVLERVQQGDGTQP